MVKWLHCDVETGGVDSKRSALLQVALILEIDGVEIDSFSSYIRPLPGKEIIDEALKINGLTREQVEQFPEASTVYRQILSFLERHINKYHPSDKAVFSSWNGRFDYDFMKQFFVDFGDDYFNSWFYNQPIDNKQLALYAIYSNSLPFATNLESVARSLGVSIPDKMHDALEDTRLMIKTIRSAIRLIQDMLQIDSSPMLEAPQESPIQSPEIKQAEESLL